jgi:AcrR family transcriptional regulator
MTNFTDRQKQIIQASLDLIANSGIHGLTIKNISKKVGISEPAIYRHFESKTDILLGIISKIKESSGMDNFVPADETKNTIAIIRETFTNRAKRFTKNPSCVNIIKKGQNEGQIIDSIDAEQLALMIIGAFRLLVTKWHMSKNSFDLEEQTIILFNALEKLM